MLTTLGMKFLEGPSRGISSVLLEETTSLSLHSLVIKRRRHGKWGRADLGTMLSLLSVKWLIDLPWVTQFVWASVSSSVK